MVVPPLPEELVDRILDNLDPFHFRDQFTLRSCALVERSWAHAAQRIIFESIFLSFPELGGNSLFYRIEYSERIDKYIGACARLTASFDENPCLTSYVRCLSLWNEARVPSADHEGDALYASTARVLQRLSNPPSGLKKLSLTRIHWAIIESPLMKAAFIDMFRIPSVTQVTIDSFNAPIFAELASALSLLENLKVLKVVKLMSTNLKAPDHADPNSPLSGSIQLNTLVVDNPVFLDWFQGGFCPLGLNNLQSLHISYRSASEYRMVPFSLKQCGHSLVELQLGHWVGTDTLEGFHHLVHLGHTPNLKRLTLVGNGQTNSFTLFQFIFSLFEPLLESGQNTRHPLQCLTIDSCISIGIGMCDEDSDMQGTPQWGNWAALDALLSKGEFDSLKEVKIVTVDILNCADEILSEYFPILKRSGKLKVEVLELEL